MKIFVAGANGYIGSKLVKRLLDEGHELILLVRSHKKKLPRHSEKISYVVGDLLADTHLESVPKDIDAAYYLVHSMGTRHKDFYDLEQKSAQCFVANIDKTKAKQIIFLGGLSVDEKVSEHMSSRRNVEGILRKAKAALTVLRAGIIIGDGSASFEIIRNLVEKLPIMVAPKWIDSFCQPIAIWDVLYYLVAILGKQEAMGKIFEIGGPEKLTYRKMLEGFAKVRGLKRLIISLPVLTPRLSSYWLIFISSTSYTIARALVNSLKSDSICVEGSICELIPHECTSYVEAVRITFIEFTDDSEVPQFGCFTKKEEAAYDSWEHAVERIFAIGGKQGWYYMDWAWKIRGYIDQVFGGDGLSKGRKKELKRGEILDCWRILHADRNSGRLVLYAQMLIPGEAWLEWKVDNTVVQIATYRPKGILGRLYWLLFSFPHYFLFRGLCRKVARDKV